MWLSGISRVDPLTGNKFLTRDTGFMHAVLATTFEGYARSALWTSDKMGLTRQVAGDQGPLLLGRWVYRRSPAAQGRVRSLSDFPSAPPPPPPPPPSPKPTSLALCSVAGAVRALSRYDLDFGSGLVIAFTSTRITI